VSHSDHLVIGSVGRIADFERDPPGSLPLPREEWRNGDYVIGEVTDSASLRFRVESSSGRLVEVAPGDLLLGALGRRAATLAIVGDWREVGEDLELATLNYAGVLGKVTSAVFPCPPLATLRYAGHAHREGRRLAMSDFAARPSGRELDVPVVLIIGTSMEAGKTVACKAIVRELKRMGLRVAATKLTGVGRLRDILAMGDAGADAIADFVDVGLPSTVVEPAEFEAALTSLLSLLADSEPDVVVAEAGASPLEPYNGDVVVRLLGDRRRCTVLCASDPYSVVGVMAAFEAEPDLISGRATANSAGVDLIERLTGSRALNLLEHSSAPRLRELLEERLGAGTMSGETDRSGAG
jgi:hypothetical protein